MKDIPKICHLYWGGSSPMPMIMVYTLLSFHKYNPEWEIIVYHSIQSDKDLGKNTYVPVYTGIDYFSLVAEMDFVTIKNINVSEYKIRKDIHSILGSDFFKTYILLNYGGVYSDFDILWLKPMEHILNIGCVGNPNDFDATICLHNLYDGHHSIGCIISKPKSRFIQHWQKRQLRVRQPFGHQSFGNDILNRIYPRYSIIKSIVPSILALRYETFYPYSIFNLEKLYVEDDLTPINDNVLGLHWFNGHPLTQDYINKPYPCSMTTILKNEGYDIS